MDDDNTLVGSARSPAEDTTTPDSTLATTTLLSSSGGGGSSNFSFNAVRRPGGRAMFSLADVVAELKRSEEVHAEMGEPPGFEEHEPPSIDEKQQQDGAALFYKFERRIEYLDKQLRDFENASRELGSSVGIVSSAFGFQERLGRILFLFRENAAHLYPRKISRRPQEMFLNTNVMERREEYYHPHHPHRSTIPVPQDNLELDMLPDQLELLARDVAAFISCLSEFDEFNDEAISQSMRSFEGDLKYFATCLYEYKNQFRSPAVQRYAHDLMFEIGGHLDEITAALTIFIEIGIPTIWFHQQHAAKNLLNVSTLSIVFGVVDASLLVCSTSHPATGILSTSVNIFWMSSLVFSIAGGVNGLLGLTWKQSIYRSPVHRVPWWLLAWMKGSPLVFLVIAIACFSAGVVLFTYSSKQNPITSAIIVVMSLVASSGLICISGWFVLERWTFLTQKEQKWLWEVITEMLDSLAQLGIVRAHRVAVGWCHRRLAATRTSFARLVGRLAEARVRKPARQQGANDNNDVALATVAHPSTPRHTKPKFSEAHLHLDVPDPRVRFQNAVRTVIKLQRTTGKRGNFPVRPGMPRRDSWWQTSMSSEPESSASPVPDPRQLGLRGARVTKLVEELKALAMTQEMTPHGALVRHVQFSPNGRFLATSSWDRTAMLFRVGDTLAHHRTLVHVRGFVSQVAWSPNGRLLLTRFTRGLKLWSEDGVCKQTIDRSKTVNSAVWLPNGQGILSVEGSEVVKLDLHGKVLDTYRFDHVRLINVAVTSDCSRLIAIGPSVPPSNGPQPTRQTKVEKRIVVYHMHMKRRESQTPLYDDVRDIVISKQTSMVLASFEEAPPQLWKLDFVRDRGRANGLSGLAGRLNLKHTFALNAATSIAGSCYFGGKEEQFVVCVGKGDVHVWDRDTAALLRYVRPMNVSELRDMTCVGWNNATDTPMMFATGSHDGAVRVWSTAGQYRVSESSSEGESDTDDD